MKRLITVVAVALACSSANAQATSPGDPLPVKLAALAQLEADIAAAPAAAQGGAAFYARHIRSMISQFTSGNPYQPYFVTEDRWMNTNTKIRATSDPVHNTLIWGRYSLNQALGQPASLGGLYRDVQTVPWP